MQAEFSPITLSERAHYGQLWDACPEHSMDYTFVNLWGWQEYSRLHWAFSDQLCWLKPHAPKEHAAEKHTPEEYAATTQNLPLLWAPVGPWHEVDWHKEACLQYGARLERVPQALMQILEKELAGRVHVEENRDQFEYLYDRASLATLPGNRYQKKRNHVNGFKKAYGAPDYRVMDESVIEDVLSLQDEWCKWHECSNSPSLLAENTAINRVLSHWQDFPHLVGGTLYVDNAMVAFSVGEVLSGGTLGVHFEKGHSSFRGVYQTMNTLFVQRAGQACSLVNREQDLGEEGLRHAKMTYLPTDFLRKYTLTIAPA